MAKTTNLFCSGSVYEVVYYLQFYNCTYSNDNNITLYMKWKTYSITITTLVQNVAVNLTWLCGCQVCEWSIQFHLCTVYGGGWLPGSQYSPVAAQPCV